MAYEFKLPDLGEGLTEGEIARWLVAEGDDVAEDQPLVAIGEDGGAAPEAPPAAPRIQATPLVRRVAQELGVDLATVTPTGPGGRITEDDVRAAADRGPAAPEGPLVGPDQKRVPGSARRPLPSGARAPEGRREKLRGVRRQIAEHLTL